MEQTGEKQVSLTDPDCRSMPVGKGHGTEVGYNVQTSVDDKHKLIVGHEVTNDVTDQGHLSAMAIRSKKVLGVKKFDLLSDMGYYDGQEVAACLNEGIQSWISKPNTSVNRKRDLFTKEDFQYSKRRDCYICPAGKRLGFSVLLLSGWARCPVLRHNRLRRQVASPMHHQYSRLEDHPIGRGVGSG